MDRSRPDLRINVWLNKETASIAPDLSGDGLHLRGYRDRTGLAPVKDTGGGGVMRSGWQRVRRCSTLYVLVRGHC